MRSTKRKVRFPKTSKSLSSSKSTINSNQKEPKLVEIESSAGQPPNSKFMESSSSGSPFDVPAHFLKPKAFRDPLKTESSKAQEEVVSAALPLLTAALDPSKNPFDFNPHGIPGLEREQHVEFLQEGLGEFPEEFVGIDSSRPWMVYWAIMALWVLGEDVSAYEESVLKTLTTFAHPTGGFSGGPGQSPHLASTYPSILTLALVASTSAQPKRLYALTHRRLLWHWLCRLKQPSGGFCVAEGGEEDVRGAYIAMVCIALLDLPLNLAEDCAAKQVHGMRHLTEGLPEWVGRCQSKWEGGIAEKPGREAHGAYAFCGLACLCLVGEPRETVRQYLNVEGLVRWLAMRQNAPEGGYSGRTNKLVDGCYTHWVGGCWPLLLGVLNGPVHHIEDQDPDQTNDQNGGGGGGNSKATTVLLQKESWIASREGVARWVLCCCQVPGGGLRDKPGKPPDTYHTLYTLSGLATTQHQYFHVAPTNLHQRFQPGFNWRVQPLHSPVLAAETEPYSVWGEGSGGEREGGGEGEEERLRALHPIFMCPGDAAGRMRAWAEREGRAWGVLEGGGIT